jgi:hypothetical protein
MVHLIIIYKIILGSGSSVPESMKNTMADPTAGRSVNECPHSTKNKTANIRKGHINTCASILKQKHKTTNTMFNLFDRW